VTEIYHVTLLPHALHSVQVWLKAVCNEGHFTLEAETVVPLYLPSHWSGVTEISHMTRPAHAVLEDDIRFKSVSNEGHFTLEAQTIFYTVHPSHATRVTII
jgi:hypothetical protein